MIQVTQLIIFAVMFVGITVLGFWAVRWRRADLAVLEEWGLAGRRLGTFLSWFLLGGDLYTAYTFVAVPGLVFGAGALGFFAVPYTIIVFPIVFVVMPILWQVARNRGYITASDFVRDRFDSRLLALLVAITGILATIPYVALQIYGIEVSIAQIGLPVDISLTIAFVVLAAFTYVSGLRAPTLIAVVKDLLIFITVIVAVIYIPIRLGGYGHVFSLVPASKKILPPSLFGGYSTLAFGSALALFLYPHAINGTLASKSRGVIKRNMSLLPAYSLFLGLIALLGYMAIAAGIKPSHDYGANVAVPALFEKFFPGPFAGFSLAAISIGALVPAAIMSIAAGNLFSRNIWVQFIRPNASADHEGTVAKVASLIIKFAALAFILAVPTQFAIYYQTAGGVWILQTLPAVFLALFVPWLDRWAVAAGWAAGMAWGTDLLVQLAFKSSLYPFHVAGHVWDLYVGAAALVANLLVVLVGTGLLRLVRAPGHRQILTPADFGVPGPGR
jgi:SSS family solute:Na+ symporter